MKSKKQQELLNTQMNASVTPNSDSSPLIENEEIIGSPFRIIGNQEKGYGLVFGKYKLSENMTTKEEVKKFLTENNLNIVLKTILCVIDFNKETAKEQHEAMFGMVKPQ